MENLGRDFEIFLPPVDKKNKSFGDVPSRYITECMRRFWNY